MDNPERLRPSEALQRLKALPDFAERVQSLLLSHGWEPTGEPDCYWAPDGMTLVRHPPSPIAWLCHELDLYPDELLARLVAEGGER